jgi:hypothetical protein
MENYEGVGTSQLESMIATVHTHQVQIMGLRSKYQKILDADDERRKEIRSHYPK